MQPKTVNRTTVNLLLDGVIFVAFLVATAPEFTGLAIHEWLSIVFGAAVITHLLLHWNWVVQVTRRFFGKVTWTSRVNYILNSLLFIGMTVIIFTGLMISEEVLPLFGLRLVRDGLWLYLHSEATDLTLLVLGLHVALHWRWIVNATNRLLGNPFQRRQATLTKLAGTKQTTEVR